MKVTRKDTPTTFSPVTLELTIESESELRTLYTLANSSLMDILSLKSAAPYEVKDLKDVQSTMSLYLALKEICEERL